MTFDLLFCPSRLSRSLASLSQVYNLQPCQDASHELFAASPRVDFAEFLTTLDYNLWDEETREFKNAGDFLYF